MPGYFWVAVGGALALSIGSLLGKAVVRYRICDAGLITWSQGLATAGVAGSLCALLRVPFPRTHWFPLACLAACIILASWLLNHALQEGDASTVVPLMGLKIPLTALLAWVFLGETATARTWSAVACSALAVSLFGVGRQRRTEGGHGYRPVTAIYFVVLSCLLFGASDVIAKRALDGVTPLPLLLWSNVLWAPVAAAMLTRPCYRQYRVTPLDMVLLTMRGVLVLGAVLGLYSAFRMAGRVILPNVIYGARGFFALVAGYILSKTLRLPMERQSGAVYALRLAGTILLAAAVFLSMAK